MHDPWPLILVMPLGLDVTNFDLDHLLVHAAALMDVGDLGNGPAPITGCGNDAAAWVTDLTLEISTGCNAEESSDNTCSVRDSPACDL